MIADCPQLLEHLYWEIRNLADVGVVGLSGGADSTLTAIISMKALGKENIYGISMPYDEVDTQTFNALSAELAERIGINHLIRPVSRIADAINEQAYIHDPSELTDLNKGNARSRARMCILYGISRTLASIHPGKRVRVMGTGNLSEDFIGYDTKGGDALADVFPIGDLFKSEVYQLLEYFRDQGVIDEEHINRIPSAGLQENQTDEGDLGYSYNEMEPGIRFCLAHYDHIATHDLDKITSFVWNRHLVHKHKHETPPIIKLRHLCD
ncbi:MAG: NAD(+) synthase [Dehalococcoidia bacterium]